MEFFNNNDDVEILSAPTSLETASIQSIKCISMLQQCKKQQEDLTVKIRLHDKIKYIQDCQNEFSQQQTSIKEKHETTKAVLEKQINELKQQKQNLNNKKLNFYLLTVIDCILFLYILYKNKDYIF